MKKKEKDKNKKEKRGRRRSPVFKHSSLLSIAIGVMIRLGQDVRHFDWICHTDSRILLCDCRGRSSLLRKSIFVAQTLTSHLVDQAVIREKPKRQEVLSNSSVPSNSDSILIFRSQENDTFKSWSGMTAFYSNYFTITPKM